jgi:hypothetical protein
MFTIKFEYSAAPESWLISHPSPASTTATPRSMKLWEARSNLSYTDDRDFTESSRMVLPESLIQKYLKGLMLL